MSDPKASNIVWHPAGISREDREQAQGHRATVLWFTGLSGSGKSTLTNAVQDILVAQGVRTYILDGDNVRHGLNRDLAFSPEDRVENIRRIAEVAKLFVDAGVVVLTAFISPYRADRAQAREINAGRFVEIHVDADLAVCEARDPKGLYKKARAGEINDFTGISAPYEAPEAPEVRVDTGVAPVDVCAQTVVSYLTSAGLFAVS
jgi:adenylylsulfate kinase